MYTQWHTIMYARNSAPPCMEVGGAYGGRWALDGVDKQCKPRTRPPCWVRRDLQGVCTLCTVLRTLSDLGGGVNGHDTNLRDKCGVCDDVTGWMGRRGRSERIHYNGTHNNVLRTTVYGGGRGLQGPVGVGWCACDKTNTVNHVHAHLVGFGGVCRTLCTVLSDLGGGVNGHDTNLRDKCGVCNDVTG